MLVFSCRSRDAGLFNSGAGHPVLDLSTGEQLPLNRMTSGSFAFEEKNNIKTIPAFAGMMAWSNTIPTQPSP
jgi:hypothetical protein